MSGAERLPLGWCCHCRIECADRLGTEVYPDRPELADKIFWVCVRCGARVGSHGPTTRTPGVALGTAANAELRRARQFVHTRLDPLWQEAWQQPAYASARAHPAGSPERIKSLAIIKKTARKRVYEFLAERMDMPMEHVHVACFDIDECRKAWRALEGVDYEAIRQWAQARRISSACAPT